MSANLNDKKCIETFANKILEELKGKVNIDYDYDETEDDFIIYHDINFEDKNHIKKFIGELIRDILLENDIYNFCLEYDPERAIKWGNNMNIYQEYLSFSAFNYANDTNKNYSVNSKSSFILNDGVLENFKGNFDMDRISSNYDKFEKQQNSGQGVLAA